MRKGARSILGWFDVVETVFYGLAAAALIVALAFLGIRAAYRLGGIGLALPPTLVLLMVVGFSVRDARRRQWSAASVGIAVVYACALVAVIALEVMVG